jgi:hypothetical protein
MEGLTVPLISVVGIFGSWCVWLSLAHYRNREEIKVNTITMQNMIQDISEIKQMQTGMNNKMDIYIAQENQFLKGAFIFMQNVMPKKDGH